MTSSFQGSYLLPVGTLCILPNDQVSHIIAFEYAWRVSPLAFPACIFLRYIYSQLLAHNLTRGIGLETSILFAKEGANVLMADISGPALEKALAKLKQVVPSHHKVETQARIFCPLSVCKTNQ